MEAIYGWAQGGDVELREQVQFAWHLVYLYADDEQPLLPTEHHPAHHFTVRQFVREQVEPDPDNNITYGQRTIDERVGACISYYYLSYEEYKLQVEARKTEESAFAGGVNCTGIGRAPLFFLFV